LEMILNVSSVMSWILWPVRASAQHRSDAVDGKGAALSSNGDLSMAHSVKWTFSSSTVIPGRA
jgi:hypothetical protein